MKKSDKVFMSEEEATNSIALVNSMRKFEEVWINIKDERASRWIEGQRLKHPLDSPNISYGRDGTMYVSSSTPPEIGIDFHAPRHED